MPYPDGSEPTAVFEREHGAVTTAGLDHDALYEELARPLRRARATLLAAPGPTAMVLYEFAQARVDELPERSYEDEAAYRELFVQRAAATFANDPYPRPVDVAGVYEANVLEPMQQVMDMMDPRLRDATVPEKMEFFRYLGQRRASLPDEAVIPVAISLLLVSMIPGSDMNY